MVNTKDEWIGRAVIDSGYWGLDDLTLIRQLINQRFKDRDHIIFYDVGANIGTHSLAISKLLGSWVTVRAFEAQRIVFYMLCGNIVMNGLTNVLCHHVAVSDQTGETITFEPPDYGELNNFGGVELIPPQTSDNFHMKKKGIETVQTVTLDSFNERVDFIKMDVEGMEDKALTGAGNILQTSRPIVYTEIAKTDQEFLKRYFKELDYTAQGTGWGREPGVNVIFQPAERHFSIPGLVEIL